MEFLNKLQLRGVVGFTRPQKMTDGDLAVSFSLATNYAYKNREGEAVIETTWFLCKAFSNKIKEETLEKLAKGSKVELTGRVRVSRYETPDGGDKTQWEVIVNDLEIIEEEPRNA